MTAAARPRHSIRFHSRSFHAMALAPQAPLADWLAELDAWVERSPGFFAGRLIVLDVTNLELGKSEVIELTKNLFERNVQIMGMKAAIRVGAIRHAAAIRQRRALCQRNRAN